MTDELGDATGEPAVHFESACLEHVVTRSAADRPRWLRRLQHSWPPQSF
jgi:hypothetical protein